VVKIKCLRPAVGEMDVYRLKGSSPYESLPISTSSRPVTSKQVIGLTLICGI
jgi:hypothetical protein